MQAKPRARPRLPKLPSIAQILRENGISRKTYTHLQFDAACTPQMKGRVSELAGDPTPRGVIDAFFRETKSAHYRTPGATASWRKRTYGADEAAGLLQRRGGEWL